MVPEDLDLSASERGDWLAVERSSLDRGEARWLQQLGRFDAETGWAADGQLSAVAWLMWRTGMARPTAYEKVRIARQLHRRDDVARAFVGGDISYSAVRAITRIDPDAEPTLADIDSNGEIDRALIDLARAGTVADVERAVRHFQLLADQERPPSDPDRHRSLRIRRHGDGTATVEVTVTELEVDELMVALDAFVDLSDSRDREGGSADSPAEDATPGPGAAAEDSSAEDTRHWPVVRVDAFVDLVRTALAAAGSGHAMGADRYLVHLVERGGELARLDGSLLDPAERDMVRCDTSTVSYHHTDQGRKERVWSTPQRRRVLVRDGGRCRFPACDRRINDIHHVVPWSAGGRTDVANGVLVCRRHHRLLHCGFTVTGDAERTLTFGRPDGTSLGASTAWSHGGRP